jgi:hypothetical protein
MDADFEEALHDLSLFGVFVTPLWRARAICPK